MIFCFLGGLLQSGCVTPIHAKNCHLKESNERNFLARCKSNSFDAVRESLKLAAQEYCGDNYEIENLAHDISFGYISVPIAGVSSTMATKKYHVKAAVVCGASS